MKRNAIVLILLLLVLVTAISESLQEGAHLSRRCGRVFEDVRDGCYRGTADHMDRYDTELAMEMCANITSVLWNDPCYNNIIQKHAVCRSLDPVICIAMHERHVLACELITNTTMREECITSFVFQTGNYWIIVTAGLVLLLAVFLAVLMSTRRFLGRLRRDRTLAENETVDAFVQRPSIRFFRSATLIASSLCLIGALAFSLMVMAEHSISPVSEHLQGEGMDLLVQTSTDTFYAGETFRASITIIPHNKEPTHELSFSEEIDYYGTPLLLPGGWRPYRRIDSPHPIRADITRTAITIPLVAPPGRYTIRINPLQSGTARSTIPVRITVFPSSFHIIGLLSLCFLLAILCFYSTASGRMLMEYYIAQYDDYRKSVRDKRSRIQSTIKESLSLHIAHFLIYSIKESGTYRKIRGLIEEIKDRETYRKIRGLIGTIKTSEAYWNRVLRVNEFKDTISTFSVGQEFVFLALAFLSLCPFLLILGFESFAEELAILAYFGLVIGVSNRLYENEDEEQKTRPVPMLRRRVSILAFIGLVSLSINDGLSAELAYVIIGLGGGNSLLWFIDTSPPEFEVFYWSFNCSFFKKRAVYLPLTCLFLGWTYPGYLILWLSVLVVSIKYGLKWDPRKTPFFLIGALAVGTSLPFHDHPFAPLFLLSWVLFTVLLFWLFHIIVEDSGLDIKRERRDRTLTERVMRLPLLLPLIFYVTSRVFPSYSITLSSIIALSLFSSYKWTTNKAYLYLGSVSVIWTSSLFFQVP